jgi:serine/threonine-protein kinase ATR
MKLFAPYWHTIAVTVVQDVNRRPQIAQQMSDLLAMSVTDFLSMTQVHTVPHFVLTKRKDILQRIADACGQSIMVLCREHNNLAAILSCVLLQTPSDVESLVMNLLNAVSPEFGNVDCAELLRSEPQATASELLRAAGESDEAKKANVSGSVSRSGRPSLRFVGSSGIEFPCWCHSREASIESRVRS